MDWFIGYKTTHEMYKEGKNNAQLAIIENSGVE